MTIRTPCSYVTPDGMQRLVPAASYMSPAINPLPPLICLSYATRPVAPGVHHADALLVALVMR
jgi:hypothetical protein